MFRAYAFLQVSLLSVRLTSESYPDYDTADAVLHSMVHLPDVTGGDIEQHVPGIGWVIAEDVESAVICARRNEE